MNLSNLLDLGVLLVILACSFEVVRVCDAAKQPWRAAAFVLITIGAFGWAGYDLSGRPVPWFAGCMHAGFALVAVTVLRNQYALRRSTDMHRRVPRRLPPTMARR